MVIGGIIFSLISLFRGEQIPSKRSLSLCFLAGLLLSLDLLALNQSVLYLGAGLSTVIANLQIIFLTLIGFYFYREKLPPVFLKMCGLIVLSVYFLIFPYLSKLSIENVLGIACGFGASLIYAVYLLLLKVIGRACSDTSATAMLAIICLFGSFSLAVFMYFYDRSSFLLSSWRSFFCIGCNSLVSQILGWWLIARGIKQLSLSLSGVLLLTQPAFTFCFDALFLGRNTAIVQLVGCSLLLGAVYMVIKRKEAYE